MPSLLDVTNQVLSKLGRPPVQDVANSEAATQISQQIPLFLQDMLMKYIWNFAIKFFTSSTPITNPISKEFLYNYEFPFDYGRFFRWEFPAATQFGMYYEIIDGLIMTNVLPISFYYVVNNIDISLIPVPFEQALIYYTAWLTCAQITNNIPLKNSLGQDYEMMFVNAVQWNDMERMKVQVLYNDFNRQTYI